MKFTKEITPQGFLIPRAALKLAGFEAGQQAEYHVWDSLAVVLKQQMTAMELLNAAWALQELAAELHAHLADVCGPCEGCEGCCPYANAEEDEPGINLPGWLRREAGISEDGKLCAEVDTERNTVVISEAGYRYDLEDLPRDIVEIFSDAGVCLEELEKHLIAEDVIYGG